MAALIMATGTTTLWVLFSSAAAIAGIAGDAGKREVLRGLRFRRRAPFVHSAKLLNYSSSALGGAAAGLLGWTLRTGAIAALIWLLLYLPGVRTLEAFVAILITVTLVTVLRQVWGLMMSASPYQGLVWGGFRRVLTGTAKSSLTFVIGLALVDLPIVIFAGLLTVSPPLPIIFALLSCLFGGVVALGGFVVMSESSDFSRRARREIQPMVRQKIEADTRSPIVFLRAFADDDLLVSSGPRTDSVVESLAGEARVPFEEAIAWFFWRFGPLHAAGKRGTKLEPLGAARSYYSDDEWRQAIEGLLVQSQMVVLIAGRSPSLQWEVGLIRELGQLHRAVFLFPPLPETETVARLRVLAASLGLKESALPIYNGSELLALYFTPSGEPVWAAARSRSMDAYAAALRDFSRSLSVGAGHLSELAPGFRGPTVDVARLIRPFSPTRKEPERRPFWIRVLEALPFA